MSIEIYYFTGTGNSLVVARSIAEKTSGILVSIRDVMWRETITVDAEVIGIVFPAYYTRIPRIVERFADKLTNVGSKYVFAVVTVGGIAGSVLDRFSREVSLHGGRLAAGFVVGMPPNNIHSSNSLPIFLQERMFRKLDDKTSKIADYVLNHKTGLVEKYNPLMTLLFSKDIEKGYREGEMNPEVDKNFWVDNKCTGCETCKKICPVSNIEMAEGKPVWQHHCEKCLACIQWCPKESIQFADVTLKRKRYHHPNVKVSDMLRQSY